MKPIRIIVTGGDTIPDGQTTNNGIANALTYIVSLATGSVFEMSMSSIAPENEDVPALTSLGGTPPTWSFTPNPSDGATYRFEHTVDNILTASFVHRIPTRNNFYYVSFGELAASGTSLAVSSSQIYISQSDDTANDNPWGYSKVFNDNIQKISANHKLASYISNSSGIDSHVKLPEITGSVGQVLALASSNTASWQDLSVLQNTLSESNIIQSAATGTIQFTNSYWTNVSSAQSFYQEFTNSSDLEFSGSSYDAFTAVTGGIYYFNYRTQIYATGNRWIGFRLHNTTTSGTALFHQYFAESTQNGIGLNGFFSASAGDNFQLQYFTQTPTLLFSGSYQPPDEPGVVSSRICVNKIESTSTNSSSGSSFSKLDTTYSPVVLYNFERNLLDESGNNLHLTSSVTEEEYIEFLPGYTGIVFPVNVSQRMYMSSSLMAISQSLTVQAVILSNRSAGSVGTDSTITVGTGANPGTNYYFSCDYPNSSNGMGFYYQGGGSFATSRMGFPHSINHVAWVLDNYGLSYYVNGKLVDTETTGAASTATGTPTLRIGSANDSDTNPFSGIIFSLKIHDTALTIDQIVSESVRVGVRT